MIESILFIIIIVDLSLFFILSLFSCSQDLLLWCAKKDDPKWTEEFDKHLSAFLRFKNDCGSAKWGDK